MAKKKPSNKEDRIFLRFLTILGIIVVGGLGYAFLDAAPALPPTEIHISAQQPNDCIACHVEDTKNAPIMPHRPMPSCISCHNKNES